MRSLRTVTESLEYSTEVEKLGGAERLDEALFGVTWAIARGAEEFPTINGTLLRFIRVEGMHLASGGEPRYLRVYFKIVDVSTAELLWLEYSEEVDDS